MFYELQPNNNQKSFYGKAKIEKLNDREILYSYDTKIATLKGGKIYRHWHGWSHTTGKHIFAFLGIRKKEWDKLKVGDFHLVKDEKSGIYKEKFILN